MRHQYTGKSSASYTSLFTGNSEVEVGRLHLMAQVFDEHSVRVLEMDGLAKGMRCLDVGAGSGTMANWLADRVHPAQVIALDRNVSQFYGPPRRNVAAVGARYRGRPGPGAGRRCQRQAGPRPRTGIANRPSFTTELPSSGEVRQRVLRLNHVDDADRRRFTAELVMTVVPAVEQLSPDRAACAESALLHELVKAAQREMRQSRQSRGSGSATNRLLTQIYPRIESYCRRRLGRSDQRILSAEDVAQEVVIAVLGAIPKYDDKGFPFMAFVYVLAERKLIDAWRKNSRDHSSPVALVPDSSSGAALPEERLMSRELGSYLGKLLEILPEKQRRVLWLRVAEDLTAAKTAMRIGSTPSSVRVMQHRGLSTLRSRLADQREQFRHSTDGVLRQESLLQPWPHASGMRGRRVHGVRSGLLRGGCSALCRTADPGSAGFRDSSSKCSADRRRSARFRNESPSGSEGRNFAKYQRAT
ncbi:sigma-70 family RNA polymerase sigma factor [Amycolatopsis sp. NPDC049868]|uniref:sigma-70 family RNA polymerase sigma factor n=1 Tax=Amycolatopsis sp. NPDC049868 TaxID=3363934 RepID=UPI0037A01140